MIHTIQPISDYINKVTWQYKVEPTYVTYHIDLRIRKCLIVSSWWYNTHFFTSLPAFHKNVVVGENYTCTKIPCKPSCYNFLLFLPPDMYSWIKALHMDSTRIDHSHVDFIKILQSIASIRLKPNTVQCNPWCKHEANPISSQPHVLWWRLQQLSDCIAFVMHTILHS
jgi:hypothetical protein